MFQNNYRGFKSQFFNVRSMDSQWLFYLEDNAKVAKAKKFPLYWYFDTKLILDLKKGSLLEFEQSLEEFLVKTAPCLTYLQPSELLK